MSAGPAVTTGIKQMLELHMTMDHSIYSKHSKVLNFRSFWTSDFQIWDAQSVLYFCSQTVQKDMLLFGVDHMGQWGVCMFPLVVTMMKFRFLWTII